MFKIKEIAFKYQSILKINFLSEVFMDAVGTEINEEHAMVDIKVKIDTVIHELQELKKTIKKNDGA